MRSSTRKYKGLRVLTLFAVVCLLCAVAVAESDSNDVDKKEILTTLEQRMQTKISVDVIERPIEQVIRMIAEPAELNVIKSPEVAGNVTAKLTNVPLEEALSNILAAHNFGYVVDRNMIRIALAKELTKEDERLVSRIYRITYANVKDVEKALEKYISKRGSLSSSIGTSHIIVTDTESNIKAIDTFIDEIDRITPQILVEVRIYDITSRDQLDLGVEWNAGQRTDFGGVGNIGTLGSTRSDETSPFDTGLFRNPTSKTGTDVTGALRFGWLNPNLDIDVVLRAQEEIVEAKLLANPRILVLDNEKALFDIVTEHPYVERTITGTSVTTTVKFKDVGIRLEVTPHVTRDGMVRLHIIPEFGVKVGEVTIEETDVPIVDTRKVNTITLVQDNQTVVLGGMRKKDVSKQINKVPLLGDLPLLGGLFRFKGEDTAITELVVFITPRIIVQPVMSETERRAFEATEFSGPEPMLTSAEKKAEE